MVSVNDGECEVKDYVWDTERWSRKYISDKVCANTFFGSLPLQKWSAVQTYCCSFYGSIIWNLLSEYACQTYRSWNTTVKVCWNLPQPIHTYFVKIFLQSSTLWKFSCWVDLPSLPSLFCIVESTDVASWIDICIFSTVRL